MGELWIEIKKVQTDTDNLKLFSYRNNKKY